MNRKILTMAAGFWLIAKILESRYDYLRELPPVKTGGFLRTVASSVEFFALPPL
ncbi:MAG: hypothetical protein ACXAEU_07430 [Candidatus Hodarchaeales archaeon]|jgi:hypothetical protein